MAGFVGELSTWPIRLNGVPLAMLADPEQYPKQAIPGYSGTYLAQSADQVLAKRDVPVYVRRFSRGAGFVERRDEEDDGGYGWALDGFTHYEQGFMPSGRRVAKGAGLGLTVSAATLTDVAVIGSEHFNGHLWCITTGGYVIRFPNADPTQTPVFDPALNAFGTATLSLRTGYVCKAIAAFAIPATAGLYDAAGTLTAALYVLAYSSGAAATRLYQYTAAGGWVESGVLTGFTSTSMASCWWEGRDGVGAQRLHIDVDPSTVRHCIYGANPLLTASWVTPIVVGNPAYPITKLLAAPTHLWVGKTNGWHDVSEIRTANVTPYWQESPNSNNARVARLYDQHLYAARAFGLDRYDTRLGDMVQQRLPGECGPGFGWQDGHPLRGQITDLVTHDGWLLPSLWNAENLTSYVGRAKDRDVLGERVRNPLVHYWAEQVIGPTAGTGQQITHLQVASPTVAGAATLSARTAYLWMFTADVPTPAGFHFNLYYAPLPQGAGPLSQIATGGTFEHNPNAVLYMTAQNWGDRNAVKHVRRYDVAGQRLSAARTIQIFARSDGDPTTITDASTWASMGTATADSTNLTPSGSFSGHQIGLQALLVTPSPYTSAPILRELSPRARVARELFDVRTIWIVLERNAETQTGSLDERSPDLLMGDVTRLQLTGPTSFIDQIGNSYNAIVEQGIEYYRIQTDEEEWRIVAKVELSLVS